MDPRRQPSASQELTMTMTQASTIPRYASVLSRLRGSVLTVSTCRSSIQAPITPSLAAPFPTWQALVLRWSLGRSRCLHSPLARMFLVRPPLQLLLVRGLSQHRRLRSRAQLQLHYLRPQPHAQLQLAIHYRLPQIPRQGQFQAAPVHRPLVH